MGKNAIPRQTLEDQEKLVLQDQGTIKNDEGIVAYDKVQVGYCHITSPITGRVGLRLVDPGKPGDGELDHDAGGGDPDAADHRGVHRWPRMHLPAVLQQTRHGQQLKVEALDRAQQGHLATGKLTSIDNQIDTTTGTVKLRARIRQSRRRRCFRTSS